MPLDDFDGCFSIGDIFYVGDGCGPRAFFFLGILAILAGIAMAIFFEPFYIGLIVSGVGVLVVGLDLWIYRHDRNQ